MTVRQRAPQGAVEGVDVTKVSGTMAALSDSEISLKRPPRTRFDKLIARPESGAVLAAPVVHVLFAIRTGQWMPMPMRTAAITGILR